MALTGSQPVSSNLPGVVVYDSAVTETLVRDVFLEGKRIRSILFDNVTPATAVYAQVFNARNPALGTDWPDLGVFLEADSRLCVVVTGDAPLFSAAVSYAFTDAPHGSTVSAATRKAFIVAEDE